MILHDCNKNIAMDHSALAQQKSKARAYFAGMSHPYRVLVMWWVFLAVSAVIVRHTNDIEKMRDALDLGVYDENVRCLQRMRDFLIVLAVTPVALYALSKSLSKLYTALTTKNEATKKLDLRSIALWTVVNGVLIGGPFVAVNIISKRKRKAAGNTDAYYFSDASTNASANA